MTVRNHNPIAFTPLPVTFLTTLAYAALFIALLVVHTSVPSAPKETVPFPGINITEAWLDLKVLTNGFHPYNSKRNDFIRNWLLQRLDVILDENNATYETQDSPGSSNASNSSKPVVVFNDMTSNLTFSSSVNGTTIYFEGTNIMVYIRGDEDPKGNWWERSSYRGPGGVLVNAHYDSVSTGYGATDDGVGVVSILQLTKYFTTPGNAPRKGLVLLLNNGEEDYLNGARAFACHPVSRFPHTFLNLEGAGAGGRATLFRSTDTEVAKFYRGTKHPFGTVVSADGFKRGAIRSQTDYIVFDDILGMRGLDVAFMEPRARYHTDQDDTRHTSIDSLWHMLEGALHTVRGLTSDTGSTFEGGSPGKGMVPSGTGSDSVWFDLFGRAFVVFELHTLFAWSVTLLVTAPLALIIISIILAKSDKLYLFSFSKSLHHSAGHENIGLHGFRGFFRYPIIFAVSTGGVVGLAFLITKVNPFIAYSSPYAVWIMMLGWWIFSTWFLSRAMDFLRPTAFHRTFALLWTFIAGWVALVISTVYEERLGISSGYLIVFYFACITLATLTTFLEQFALERKSTFAEFFETETESIRRPASNSSSARQAQESSGQTEEDTDNDDVHEAEQANESTSLLGRAFNKGRTFANYSSPQNRDAEETTPEHPHQDRVYEYEQAWSWSLPSSTWLLQFLLIGPWNIILVGQVALLYVSASYQTLADGNPPLLLYLAIASLSVLLLVPLGPFLHRFTYHVPTFLFFIVVGTMIYNLIAFPFSGNNRLKLYFIQRVDLDTGINEVGISGAGKQYLEEVINSLPSTAGQPIKISKSARSDLTESSWNGLAPRVVPGRDALLPPDYANWLHFDVSRIGSGKQAQFHIKGSNTRSCRIYFNSPASDVIIAGSNEDSRFPRVLDGGSKEIRLWSREWERPWNVSVSWTDSIGLDGRVACLWNDEDGLGTIPALDEVRRFAPDWVAITKLGDGLVEGSKAFTI